MTLSDLTSKTPEELNVKLFETFGNETTESEHLWKHKDSGQYTLRRDIPNYTGSWDAIMPELLKLDEHQQDVFAVNLVKVTQGPYQHERGMRIDCTTKVLFSKPLQLTQAIILTLTSTDRKRIYEHIHIA